MHFLHLCVRVSQTRKVPQSDLGWEDMYREEEGESWFDWVSIYHKKEIYSAHVMSVSDRTGVLPAGPWFDLQYSLLFQPNQGISHAPSARVGIFPERDVRFGETGH